MWVLGSEPRSSARATRALDCHCPAIPPATPPPLDFPLFCACAMVHMEVRDNCRSWFSPSTVWGLGIELWFSALVASLPSGLSCDALGPHPLASVCLSPVAWATHSAVWDGRAVQKQDIQHWSCNGDGAWQRLPLPGQKEGGTEIQVSGWLCRHRRGKHDSPQRRSHQ